MPDSICPICEEPIIEDSRYGYRETDVQRFTCKDCWQALMNLCLLQKLNRYRRGDPRVLLRQELGIKGKYQEVGKITK